MKNISTLTKNQKIAYNMMQIAKKLGIQNYDASHWKEYVTPKNEKHWDTVPNIEEIRTMFTDVEDPYVDKKKKEV